MTNKQLIWKLVILLFIIIIGYFIIDQLRTTTYAKLVNDAVSEEEEFRRVHIDYHNKNNNDWKEMNINNHDEIIPLIEHPSNMKLKTTNKRSEPLYLVIFQTSKGSFTIRSV